MPTGKHRRGLWAIGAALVLGAGTVSVLALNGGADPPLGVTAANANSKVQRVAAAPDDPLTDEEVRAATEAALGVTVRSTPGQGAPELLYVERDDDKQAAGTRRHGDKPCAGSAAKIPPS